MWNRKRIAFVMVSTLFLVVMIGIYGYRLLYYYKLEHPSKETDVLEVLLSDALISNNKIVSTKAGLYYVDDHYIVKGNVDTNYVSLAGRTFRVMAIDEQRQITLITDEVQALSRMDSQDVWLDSFLDTLKAYQELIVPSTVCQDYMETITDTDCEQTGEELVHLLTIEEYLMSIKDDTYITNGLSFWLSSKQSNSEQWYVNEEGKLVSNTLQDEYKGMRPVITIQNTNVLSGTGTKDNPYVLVDDVSTTLADTYIGNYVLFSDQTWRVIAQDNETVKLAYAGVLTDAMSFSGSNHTFDVNVANTAAYYLNHFFFSSLSGADMIIESVWYQDITFNQSVLAKVGLMMVTDYFLFDVENYMTMTQYDEATIYHVKSNGTVFVDFITTNTQLRPVIGLASSHVIVDGKGTSEDPYRID